MVSAVIFDLDGTLTNTPSPWRYIHERLGLWENTACAYLEQWLGGRISYEEFCQRDARLWSGRTLPEIESFLDEIEMNRHLGAVVRELVERKIPSVIISSGFRYVADKIQRECGWEPLLIYANELIEGPEVRINVSGDFSSPLSKKAHADAALRVLGVHASDTLVVSDALRDLEQLCDCGRHLHIKEESDLLGVVDHVR
jgi:phosphoserine phosphatase